MRKANPAFCDRSKSHKKLDPFDDRKMVRRLPENPSSFAAASRMSYARGHSKQIDSAHLSGLFPAINGSTSAKGVLFEISRLIP